MLRRLNRRRSDATQETPEFSEGTDHANCDAAQPTEAPEVISEDPDVDLTVDRLAPADPSHDSVIPIDSAPEQIKKIQERRRRRRKPFPEPPVPTFVMVSPGRYIRAEENVPSSVVPTGRAEQDNPTVRTLEPTEETAVPAAVSIPKARDGYVNPEFGAPRSSDFDQAGGTGIEVSLVSEPACEDEPEKGSDEEQESGSRCA
jgi:hypothetical protein